jgi:hypothetical protein
VSLKYQLPILTVMKGVLYLEGKCDKTGVSSPISLFYKENVIVSLKQ